LTIGVMIALTKLLTTAWNAVPMTTAMASSTTLPRMMKSLKPLSIASSESLPQTNGALAVRREL
jgi:hypothetical protein